MKRFLLSGLLVLCFFSMLHAQTITDTAATGVRIQIDGPRIVPTVSPLVLVNGLETDMQSMVLNPNSIEKIDVLKNNADVAKYGERAKNGVILITTKPGVHFYTITHFVNPEKNINTSVKQIELNGKMLVDMKKLLIEKKANPKTTMQSGTKMDEKTCDVVFNDTLVITTAVANNLK